MIAPLPAETTGSLAPRAGDAPAQQAPTDLFGALLALLGAVPLAAEQAVPDAPAAEATEVPEADDANTDETLTGVAGALASLLAALPAPAQTPVEEATGDAIASAAALPAIDCGAAARIEAAFAASGAEAPARDALAQAELERAATAAADAETALSAAKLDAPRAEATTRDRAAQPAFHAAKVPAPESAPTAEGSALELARAAAPVAVPITANEAVRSPAPAPQARSPRDVASAKADARLADALAQRAAALPPARARVPELGLEPVPVDAAQSPERALPPSAFAAPPPTTLGAHASARADAIARAESQESARAVTDRVVWLADQGGGSARLELNPPELGQVEIVVRVRGRRVEVHVRAEEAAAQQVVREGRERLEGALAARDLQMDGFSVNGGASGNAGSGSREAAREGAQQNPGFQRAFGEAAAPRSGRREPAPARAVPTSAIDLRV